ncbi:hypothetical protein Q7P37_003641 [Cladosporium fusiforme]
MDSISLDLDTHCDLFTFDDNFQPDWTASAYTPPNESSLGATRGFSNSALFDNTGPVKNTEDHGHSQPFGDNGRELLAFHTLPESRTCVLNASNEPTTCDISARVSGMLFVAQDASKDTPRHPHRTSGLTCYRRNMLKVIGHAHVSRDMRLPASEGREPIPISNVVAILSACETLADQDVRLVVHSAKNATGPQNGELEELEPESIKLDVAANADWYSEPGPPNISWDRLQFRHATTKSNRRNAPQQHFRLVIEIKCIASGEEITLCKAVSVPIDVRGRSPKSYITQTDAGHAVKRPRYNSNDSHNLRESFTPFSEPSGFPAANSATLQSSISSTAQATVNSASDDWISDLLAGSHEFNLNQFLLPQCHPQAEKSMDDTFEGVLAGLANKVCDVSEERSAQATPSVPGCFNDEGHPSSAEDSETASSQQGAEHSYEYYPLSALDWTTPAEAVYVRFDLVLPLYFR